jgi:hypothetical protein
VINNNIIEEVNSFDYLGYAITVSNDRDLEIKMNIVNQMCSTIRRTLNNKTRKQTQITSYKAMAVLTPTGCGAHPASGTVGARGRFPGDTFLHTSGGYSVESRELSWQSEAQMGR